MLEWALRRVTSFTRPLALLHLSMSPTLLPSSLCCDAAGDGKDEAGRLWPQTSGYMRPTQEEDHWDKTQGSFLGSTLRYMFSPGPSVAPSLLCFITGVGNVLLFLLKEQPSLSTAGGFYCALILCSLFALLQYLLFAFPLEFPCLALFHYSVVFRCVSSCIISSWWSNSDSPLFWNEV